MNRWNDERNSRVFTKRIDGATLQKIADEEGITRQRVSAILRYGRRAAILRKRYGLIIKPK